MTPILDPEREFINKWEMYKLLTLHSIKNIKIPETRLFAEESFSSMITEYPLLYIKPIGTWEGHDISTVQKNEDCFEWKIQGKEAMIFKDLKEVYNEMNQFYHDKTAIIQRGIPAIKYDGRPFDIRAHLFKEMDGSWTYAGDLIRLGGEGAIVSNIWISNGSVKPTDEFIPLLLLEKNHSFSKDILRAVSFEVCKMLDQYHFFTEVGMDFTLDKNGNLWIIEVNTNDLLGGPDPNLFSMLPDQSAYERIMNQKGKIYEEWVHSMLDSFNHYIKEKHGDGSRASDGAS